MTLKGKSDPGPLPPDLDADARLAAIVDSSFDAIISKNLDSIVTTWDHAAEHLFGYVAEEMIGRSIRTLIPDALQGEEVEIIERVRTGERVASYETTRRHKSGRLVAVSLTVSPILSRSGEIVGASQIARDITETREKERQIKMLMREVNHRVKNQFAVILSMVRETSKRTADPAEFEGCARSTSIETGIEGADVVMMLRIQKERFANTTIPAGDDYFREFGLTAARLAKARPDAIVMHPQPMNRGVEIDGAVADGPRSVIRQQVTNGVAVRMAALEILAAPLAARRAR